MAVVMADLVAAESALLGAWGGEVGELLEEEDEEKGLRPPKDIVGWMADG